MLSNQPAKPPAITTNHGGSFQNIKATKASTPKAKSCALRIALVQTG
jgi:hypothetical protein